MATQLDFIQALVQEVLNRLPPAGTVSNPKDETPFSKSFQDEFKRLTPAEFQAKYGVAYGSPLPPLPSPPPPDKVKEYAAQWYSWQGFLRGPMPLVAGETQEAVANQAISDNANELATYYTGLPAGVCDAYVAVVACLTGMVPSYGYYRAFLGGSSPLQPYINPEHWDFSRFCESLPGGSPSGG